MDHTFQLISDIHLEFYIDKIPEIEVTADNLILAGDIGYPYDLNYELFIKKSSKKYNNIYLITGNHEYYNTIHTKKECDYKIYTICKQYKNIYFLNMGMASLDNIRIIGTTMWTYLDKNEYNNALLFMNDYKYINSEFNKLWTPEDMVKTNQHEITWLLNMLYNLEQDKNVEHVIVVTHHAPSLFMCKYEDHNYGNQLDQIITKYNKLKYWCSGHTHLTRQYKIDHIKCISNCYGYKEDDKTYDNQLVIKIEKSNNYITEDQFDEL